MKDEQSNELQEELVNISRELEGLSQLCEASSPTGAEPVGECLGGLGITLGRLADQVAGFIHKLENDREK